MRHDHGLIDLDLREADTAVIRHKHSASDASMLKNTEDRGGLNCARRRGTEVQPRLETLSHDCTRMNPFQGY